MKKNYSFYWLRRMAVAVICFLVISAVGAQTMQWHDSPKQYPHDLVALGDSGYLYINVHVAGNPLTSPTVKVDLPKGVDFVGGGLNMLISEPGLTATNLFIFGSPTGSEALGTRSMTLTTKGSLLYVGDSLVMKFKIRATYNINVVNPGDFTVTVTGEGTVIDGVKSLAANLIKPALRIVPDPALINYANVSDVNQVKIDIDATAGYTYSTLITLTYDGSVVTLDNFQFDGVSLTDPLPSNSGPGVYHSNRTSVNAVTRIRLDRSVLVGRLDNVVRHITFDASSKYGCNRTIGTSIQNTLTTNYDSWKGSDITLSLPGGSGLLPVFSHNGDMCKFNDFNAPAISYTDFCYDGSAPSYWVRQSFTNTNGIEAAQLSFRVNVLHQVMGNCAYIGTDEVYYKVSIPSKLNGSDSIIITAKQLLSSSCITGGVQYTNSVTHASAILGKYAQMVVNFPYTASNPIPPNAKVEIIYPVYCNPAWLLDPDRARSDFMSVANNNTNFSVAIRDGVASSVCGGSYNFILSPIYILNRAVPHFTVAPSPSYSVVPSIPTMISASSFGSGNMNGSDLTTGDRYAEVFVKMPVWLKLDPTNPSDPITSAFVIGASTLPVANSGQNHGVVNGYQTYSVRFNNGGVTGIFNVRVVADPCTGGSCPPNTSDTIQLWSDWVSGTNSATSCYPRFQKMSKVWSIVTRVCKPVAMEIIESGAYRITRGLKDSDNNHIPDDGTTLAPDNEINHYLYQQQDTGYYYVKCVVKGGPYKELKTVWNYITDASTGAIYPYYWAGSSPPGSGYTNTGVTTPLPGSLATVEFKRPTLPGTTYTEPLNILVNPSAIADSVVAQYNYNSGFLPQDGDTCLLKIPFTCLYGYGTTNGVGDGRGEVSVTCSAVPQSSGICDNGESISTGFPVCMRRFVLQNANATVNFPMSCEAKEVSIRTRSGNDAMNWDNEVRYHHKLDSMTVVIPHGFARTTDSIKIQTLWYGVGNTLTYTSMKSITPDKSAINAAGDSLLTVYFAKYIDYTYNDGSPGNVTNGITPAGLLIPGDDRAGVVIYIDSLIATPGAAGGNNYTLAMNSSFTTQRGALNNGAALATLNYSGERLYLITDPKTLLVTYDSLLLQSVEVNNPNSNAINKDVWLFVAGNVSDAKLLDLNTNTVLVNGGGLNNCWLHIGDIEANSSKNYRLVFRYTGGAGCGNDAVTVHTVMDAWKTGWTPTTSSGIDAVPLCNRGQAQITILDQVNCKPKIAGSVAATIPGPDNKLSHNVPYTVDYVVDAQASQGTLYEPYVVITAPMGQVYTDTTTYSTAKYVYPAGTTPQDLPLNLRNKLKASIGETSNDKLPRTDTIWMHELLETPGFAFPGWGADPYFGFNNVDRIVKITLPFVPTCETDLLGIRYRGTYHGKKFCGDPCVDDGTQYVTPTIYTDVATEYSFQVHVQTTNPTNHTFTPHHTQDTLEAKFKKNLGIGDTHIPMDPDDSIRVTLPKDFTVNGTITSPQFGTMTVNYTDGGVDPYTHERVYMLYLPVDSLNARIPHFTDTMTFYYYIPIEYHPDPTGDCQTEKEEHECKVQVVTHKIFAEGCPPHQISLGVDKIAVLNLNFDDMMFNVCPNVTSVLEFGCDGVTLEWYDNESATPPPIAIGNSISYTPPPTVKDTLYIHVFYDYYNDYGMYEDFGIAPVYIHVYPEVIAAFKADTVFAGDPTTFTNLSTVGGSLSDAGTATLYWYVEGNDTPFSDAQKPTHTFPAAGTYNVTLVVVSMDGCSDTITIPVVVKEPPTTVALNLKVFLQGVTPDNGGVVMTNYIQEPDLTFTYSAFFASRLQTSDPYGLGAYYADINDPLLGAAGKVVDWVKVEIWGNINAVGYPCTYDSLEVRALLLKPDGTIVDIDGKAPQFEPQTSPVHIVIKHRDHLPVMSQLLPDLNSNTNYDFSTGLTQAYRHYSAFDPDPMVLTNGVYCMWAGEINDDGIIDVIDVNGVKTDNISVTYDKYIKTDIDMNGVVDYGDVSIVEKNTIFVIYSPVVYFTPN